MTEHVHEKEISSCGCDCCGAEEQQDMHSDKRELLEIAAGAVLFVIGLVLHLAFDMKTVIFLPVFLAAYIILGREVIFDAVKGLLGRNVFNENLLMTIATLGAFGIGSFDEAVGVMLFYRVGEWFEHRAAGSARRSVTALLDIRPDTANVLRGNEIISVSPEEAAVGDLILVRPGERVPLDGTVTVGSSALDTSALTGEALPRNVAAGDTALSGCVNLSGALTIRVEKPYGESTVEKILELVQNAAAKKAPAEKFITKFAKIYTPVVVALAVFVAVLPPLFAGADFSVWLHKALTLLVISCPCALVLSIPLAFFGGIGAASRRGVLIKGGNFLDALNSVETVAFDKTGTLTYGRFKVTEILAEGCTDRELLELAALAECYSTHPIARSIIEAYGSMPDTSLVADYAEIAGNGVRATIRGEIVLTGSAAFLRSEGIDSPQFGAGTQVFVARGGVYMGCITAADAIRPDSANTVRELRKRSIKTVMLTGDNGAAAKEVAETLGIDEYRAGLLPGDKVAVVEELMNGASGKLAFLGDGINDAPVLAVSDVGIVMGGLGSDAAIEAADIILMTDEPSRLCEALDIAAGTRAIVIQNIILALGIKLVILTLGIFVGISMWAAVFADVGVALLAVLNSARLAGLSKKRQD